MSDTRKNAERLHTEAQLLHLDQGDDLRAVLAHIRAEAIRLVAAQPHLAGADPRLLYSRVIVSTSAPLEYGSVLRRAALAVLLVAAVEREESADPLSGDAA